MAKTIKVTVFDTEKRAKEYADKMNKNAKAFKYVIAVYPKEYGGNDKKVLVKKYRK